ncbi:thrombospondin type-1 domain-containing protein 1-like isoform X2 [Myxocyprinus asiaticus]|uniref:thrombospondin type-1 domain-containing protein 1-like isoform X2 n=1 Tax=Myxocyprinus asiaticus TaxID=70543 RepID=UPI002222E05E|nr:thrombospondin type-1 domain-containing protein 1-like isoform X2 [Myxocyprinus asiaticus]XP_051539590.1 thrombospondin type-1 domain-containing protein 1-like isoform X2 [Myxocyprinus asiaticus]XP_051539591.1 thrombospondin type-1 domain-containing protein 1-like isoform X2 [Myxocyprinus asiaticus]XP_051539592.1 thrombospondin type-1 domain-containing protein 1-like isoform X2 [Myxocyprinus asiaticus]
MKQGFPTATPFLLLFLIGFAMAGIHLWPSMHIALSNASVFVDYSTVSNLTDHRLTVSLIDIDRNITVLTRPLPFNQSEGSLEFNCSCFLYAGNFRYKLEQIHKVDVSNQTAIWWYSPVLHVHWPNFHLAVDRGSNDQSSNDLRIGVYTSDHFHPCPSSKASSLYLDVSYLEQMHIGRNTIDKLQSRKRHIVKVVRSQHVELTCASPLTEHGFIQISIKSPHIQQDIKSSGPLYLSSIFPYKLLVDNIYKSGCEGAVSVHRIAPPCTVTNGKVLLYKEESKEKAAPSHLAFNFLTQGENETEFNCSIFDPGRNKYCFHFTLVYSQASLTHTCVIVQRNSRMWGPWQPWSGCSVTCGEGVRERERECLLPSGGGIQCTGMVREQSHCSLEDCTGELPPLSVTPPPAVSSPLAGNLVVVAGISLCLAVILATILITVWRKLCHAPNCSPMRHSSVHSPSGRKNSDEASICGHSTQRPSFSESLQAAPLQKGLTVPAKQEPSDRGVLARQQSMSLLLPLPQDPERMSPSGQKIVPPIFGYRLAQQQLKEMKKKGLKEATQVYHVSQSPVDDTLLEATASNPAGLTPVPQEVDSPEEANSSQFRTKSPFLEPTWPPKILDTLSDRHKVDMLLGPQKSVFSANAPHLERTADWVEMIERNRGTYSKNPNFRRTSSFHENNQQQLPALRLFRERSMTRVTPRQLPEGSCRNRTWEQTLPKLEVWSCFEPRITDSSGDHRRRPWVDTPPSQSNSKDNTLAVLNSASVTPTKDPLVDRQRLARSPSSAMDRAERAEQNWSRRGPSPIQRNILARKLREANSSTCQRQRSSTFSTSEQYRGRCRSLPLSADYSSYPCSLTESEQHMMDISGYLGEEDGVEVLNIHRLT